MAGVAGSEADVVMVAGVPARSIGVEHNGLNVRLWGAADLAGFVDVAALLYDDDPPEPPYWMHLWPGALALARVAAAAGDIRPGARVLELGCGLALPAVVAARRGAAVVASDRQRAPLDFVRRSAAANGCQVDLLQMDWTAAALRGCFDVCLGADVGYDAGAEQGLVDALARVTARDGVIWLADSVNTARTSLVQALRVAGFSVQVTQVREWEEGRPVWVRLIEARSR